jgi:hypothetical protein
MKGPLVLIIIVALITAPAFADKITLKSGDTYSGEIIEETKEYIRLRTDSKIVKIKKAAIAEIASPDVEVEVEEEKPSSPLDARAKGTAAAEAEVNKMLWAGIGFLLGLVGVVIAYVVTPSPPQSHLIGKDMEYVAAFTDAFQSKGRSIQGNYALMGCVVGSLASAACWAIIFAAAEE